EAGTGTGKTLAYLVPAILSGKKVVVSTATRALQEQIYFKDLPIVAEVLATYGIKFRAALMKGLSNYLCRRRLHEALLAGDASFRLKQWAEETESGDRSELADLAEDDPAWAAVMSGTDTRIGAECTYFDECFVTRMKREAEQADVVVVNHHLFCADLVLRRNQRERASAIPAYDAVIFDEAHQLEDVATTFFGSTVSTARIDSLARDARRAMPVAQSLLAQPVSDQLSEAGRGFFWELARSLRDDPPQSVIPSSRGTSGGGRRALAEREWTGELLGARSKLETALAAIAHDAQTRAGPASEQIARRALELGEVLVGKTSAHEIAWVEHRGHNVVMGRSPVFIGDVLAESLFGRVRSVVATSATLTTPGEEGGRSFDFLKERLGVPHDARSLAVASPFDFAERAGLYVPRDVPDPTDARFEEAAAARAVELIEITGGGAFVLCTSVRSMRSMYSRISRARAESGGKWGPLLVQGEKPKSLLLSQFRAAEHAVLVATMSFWEGVDVPGHALRLVVLDKIPFAVPSDPIVAARCELIEREGLNAFYKYSVPTAAISLKQGFGRLLRNETDYGLVALLDRRALTKPYGRALLQSLPPARQLRTLGEVQKFWVHIDHDVIANPP
ncbi:MAG TPA: ATP-dependent DNA helicase, partial [Polyangiaceae bacterium]|nr:ATP-dependent DNA helicase [Polyangiaceae bacterium]